MFLMIYADPMTNLVRIGYAQLLRKLVTYSRRQTGWQVRFPWETRTRDVWICS